MSDATDGPGPGLPPRPQPRPVPGPSPRPLPPHLDPRRGRGRLPQQAASRPGGARPPQAAGRAVRVLRWLAVLASFSVLASSVGGYALLNYYDGRINRLGNVFSAERPPVVARDARNVLIVGSDSRGADGRRPKKGGGSRIVGQRSDTVILAHLYGDTDKAQLVSFPRDAWVAIPEHRSVRTGEQVEERMAKLNSALFDGGPQLLIRTIEQLTGLRVDNYLQIDFTGFQAMVEKLGGVEVCLSKPQMEKDSGINLPAGRQTIRGKQALAFVRQRKGLPNGDLDRIGRQQQFIGAIVRKTLSAGTLLNPVKLNGVIRVATESLQVDETLTISDLRDLALRFQGFDAGGVLFSTAPVADVDAFRAGQSVVLLDEAKGRVLYDQLRRDVPPSTPRKRKAGPSQPLVVPPSAVRVRVLNGAGVAGLGRRAYDDLSAVGFQLVGGPGNRGSGATDTTVFHGPDKADSARTVAAALPGSRVQLDPELTRTLEVVVGSSYSGARQVEVGAGRTPAPTASPGIKTAAEDPCKGA